MNTRFFVPLIFLAAISCNSQAMAQGELEDGFVSLFNGQDLTGWKIPEGDNGHWRVLDGVIDYDASTETPGKIKDLWSDRSYGDFILKVDWRLKSPDEVQQELYDTPVVLPDGRYLKDAAGNRITMKRYSPDSGVYLRGTSKAQVNAWGWPIGSGEVYGYRNEKVAPEVRAGVTPRINADKPLGEWNRFEIFMINDRLTVLLNSHVVLADALLPDIPSSGPIALQHHGGRLNDTTYKAASSLVQFRNIWIKELPVAPTAN